jgi:hypothetical protein
MDDSYSIYMVKRNTKKELRLTSLASIMKYALSGQTGFLEVEITNPLERDINNPLLQKDKIIWWSPLKEIIWEATQDDERAKEEYQLALRTISSIPDLTPETLREGDSLIRIVGEGDVYKVIDGNLRRMVN